MPVLQKRYNVPHFDAKGEAHRFFAQQRVPVTYLYTSACWENLIHFGMGPQRRADGALAVTFPTGDARIPWVGVEDIGFAAARNLPARRSAGVRVHRRRRRSSDRRGAGRTARRRARRAREPSTRSRPMQYRALRFPGRGRARQHVAVQARLRARVPRAPRSRAHAARCIPDIANFASLAWRRTEPASGWRRRPEVMSRERAQLVADC